MDEKTIVTEISVQSQLVDGIALSQAMVTAIDRHMKDQEHKLNEKLVHFPIRLMLRDFLPEIPINHIVTKVDDDMWRSLSFVKSWRSKSPYEEISYDKGPKGFAFFYRTGEVEYDIGIRRGPVGMETYYKVIEDSRETIKVVGASVEIKLRAFKNLRPLLSMIANQANNVASVYRNELGEVDGNKDLSRVKVNLKEIGHMGQMETIRHLMQPQDPQMSATGNPLNRMSLNMAEAFTPAELAEIERNTNKFF